MMFTGDGEVKDERPERRWTETDGSAHDLNIILHDCIIIPCTPTFSRRLSSRAKGPFPFRTSHSQLKPQSTQKKYILNSEIDLLMSPFAKLVRRSRRVRGISLCNHAYIHTYLTPRLGSRGRA